MFRERCKDYTSQIDFQGRHLNIIEEKHALMPSNLPEGSLAVYGFQLCISKWALCPFCHHLHIILKFGFQTLCPQYTIRNKIVHCNPMHT